MRALVLVFLLANAVYFAWASWIDAPGPPAAAAALAPLRVLPAQAPNAAPTPHLESRRCAALGPLADADASRAAQAALVAQRLGGRERQVVVEELEGWWVHIDRLADAAARTRAIHRLQAAGIHGAVALAETDQVSVGLFSEQSAAEARAAAVRKAGYKAEAGPRNHLVTRYWLDVEAAASVPLPAVESVAPAGKQGAAPSWQPCPAAPGEAAPATAPQG